MTIRPIGSLLPPRERDALRLTADGMTPSQVAAKLLLGAKSLTRGQAWLGIRPAQNGTG